MYLTRMPLNIARGETRRLVASPYRLHAAVEASFPPGMNGSDDGGRILWRLDRRADGPQEFWLYIVSPEKPDLTHVVEQSGWPIHERLWETKDYTPLLNRIENGQRWEFRLKANPVRKVREDKRPNRENRDESVVGTIQGHVTVAQQVDWLASRAAAHGFELPLDANGRPAVVVSQRNREVFRRGDDEVTLSTAQYDGALTVTDAECMRATLCQGIGRAKGFGCGLLTIAPVR